MLCLSLLLAACGLDIQPVGLPPSATPTASLAAGETRAAPSATYSPSPTELPPGFTPEPTLSPTPSPYYTPTETITPWPNDSPTPGPSPTRTFTPTRTRIPTRTRAPSLTPTTTMTPTITNTPTPPAPIQELVRPGLMSKVLSPIQIEMYTLIGDDGMAHVALIGEDGRVIAQQDITNTPRRYIYEAIQLDFEIPTVSEFARLQVRSVDEFGRPLAISSVDLVLLTVGRAEIFPAAVTEEPFLVRAPARGATVTGGTLVVDGVAHPVNDSPVILELIDEAGQVLLSQQFNVAPPSGGMSHTPFHLELAYKVSASTPVRLVVRQEGSRIPGTLALNSQLLVLEP
jgi:hypothetical protein